jgi:hypothetical protein
MAARGPDQGGTRAQRPKLAPSHVAAEGHHPAVRAGEKPVGGDMAQRQTEGRCDVLRRFDPVGRHVDRPYQHVLAFEEPDELDRDVRIRAFERHLPDHFGQPRRNLALVFSPEGNQLAEYDKKHFIPVFEDGYQIGAKPEFFPVSGVKCGVAICKDMDFPNWTAQYARAGAGILFVPAWDFVQDEFHQEKPATLGQHFRSSK